MKKFIVYLLVIVVAVSLGFAIFYLVRDDETISLSTMSVYKDVGDTFTIDLEHDNPKNSTKITVTSSDDSVVKYDSTSNKFTAMSGGLARINFRTTNTNFRNLWCDVVVGDGTVESPYYISTAEQLAAIGAGNQLTETNADGSYIYAGAEGFEEYRSDLCYKIVADIDATTINNGYWVPLRNFSGRFDGNGRTISNINIDRDAYATAYPDKVATFTTENAGLFQTIACGVNGGVVYNLKISNFSAKGNYTNFGVIAGTNNGGTIERIEIFDTFLDVNTNVFGGIVAINETTEYGNAGDEYVRNIARIDRCSINLNLGQMYDGDSNKVHSGNLGVIGGIVGNNKGGTIVYSYVVGDVYFAEDSSTAPITYGGVVAVNEYKTLTKTGGRFANLVQGANLRDCYSSVKTHLRETVDVAESSFAGAIAKNVDFSNKLYNGDANQEIVSNYIIGVYYNQNYLRYEQDEEFDGQNILINLDKSSWVGIAKFTYNTATTQDNPVTWADTECIVKGLTTDNMKVKDNFKSHNAMVITFDDYGNIDKIEETPVLWLFDSVWTIDVDGVINNGMPYLNYQLVYIPDDFDAVGVPTIQNSSIYSFVKNNDYPISIAEGNQITIKVGDTQDLTIKPVGTVINSWVSSDNNVVSVDPNGKINGVGVGTACVTATSAGGSTASITVVVESVTQDFIVNYPSTISVYVGQNYAVTGISAYSMDSIGNRIDRTSDLSYFVDNTIIATVNSNGVVYGGAQGNCTLYISLNNSTAIVSVPVVVTNAPTPPAQNIYITCNFDLSVSSISGDIGDIGTLSYFDIKDSLGNSVLPLPSGVSVSYLSLNSNVASIDSATGAYTLNAVGTTSFMITISGNNGNNYYSGSAMVGVTVNQPVVNPPAGGGTTPQPVTFTFKQNNFSVTIGKTLNLANEINNSSSAVPVYSSYDISTATIDSSTGILTPVKTGTVSIVATIVDNGTTYTTSCVVSIVNPVLSFNLTASPATSVKKGTSVSITLNITSGALSGNTTWTNSNTSVATTASQSNVGLTINTIGVGSTTITAKNGSSSASITITISDDHPYSKYIYNREQLENVRYHLDKDFILASDIDLSASEWTPIGTMSQPFTGSIENLRSYTISNMNITTANNYNGLFGYVKDASIEGMRITSSSVTNALTSAGAVVGYATNSTISQCHVTGTTSISGAYKVGGIVGIIAGNSVINNCSVQGNVTIYSTSTTATTVINQYVGGIVGIAESGTITNVYVSGASKVTIYSTSVSGKISNVGGIVGAFNSGSIDNAVVDNANIQSKLDDAGYSSTGGIVGYTKASISRATVSNSTITGGLVGGAIGEMANQSGSRTVEMNDSKENYKGYVYDNIKSKATYNSYAQDAKYIAVTSSVSVTGQIVGGLAGCVTSGILANSYTQATLCGTSTAAGDGIGLLAGKIMGQKNKVGSVNTTFGVVDLCYSACSISGSSKGIVYAPSITAVHQKHDAGSVGFAFRYVCLEVSKAKYYYNSNMAPVFGAPDYPDSIKSASEMKTTSTFTDKGFGAVWSITDDSYPTLTSSYSANTSWL